MMLLEWLSEVKCWFNGCGHFHCVSWAIRQFCQPLRDPALPCQTEIFLHHHIKPLEARRGRVAGGRHGDVSADSSSAASCVEGS